ncbi:MAG: hypothetical protein ACUVV6_04360 [Thermoplasmatota archaeon]
MKVRASMTPATPRSEEMGAPAGTATPGGAGQPTRPIPARRWAGAAVMALGLALALCSAALDFALPDGHTPGGAPALLGVVAGLGGMLLGLLIYVTSMMAELERHHQMRCSELASRVEALHRLPSAPGGLERAAPARALSPFQTSLRDVIPELPDPEELRPSPGPGSAPGAPGGGGGGARKEPPASPAGPSPGPRGRIRGAAPTPPGAGGRATRAPGAGSTPKPSSGIHNCPGCGKSVLAGWRKCPYCLGPLPG